MPASSSAAPRPSAAVALLRGRDEGGVAVFLVRRHTRMGFMPDVYVFPGGSVTPDDVAAERAPLLCAPSGDGPTALGNGFRVAALRECFEEAGVLLARRGAEPLALRDDEVARFAAYRDALAAGTLGLGEIATRERLTLATDDLVHWAHWITPLALPKRFDTHFFLAAMPHGQEAAHDHLENSASAWRTPEEALALFEQGVFPLAHPTVHQLRALCGLADVADARRRFINTTPPTILPRIEVRDGRQIHLMPDEE